MGDSKKSLVVFDFDHTIVDSNTDLSVRDMIDGEVPDEVEAIYSDRCWNEYMNAIFHILHTQSVTVDDMTRVLERSPLTNGMQELLQYLAENKHMYSVIIISDSNVLFIDILLRYYGLSEVVYRVYSNPASVDSDGQLRIRYYHHQTGCDISSHNMCKGKYPPTPESVQSASIMIQPLAGL